MASISERENREVEAANGSGDAPTPDWSDDPATVEAARTATVAST
jgi:hypothetical protein